MYTVHKEDASETTVNVEIDGQKREYVIKIKNSVEKKLKCSQFDPVKVLNVKTNGKPKVNSEKMTVQLNLGMFEHLIRNLGKELKQH